jgi:hypothetical protein
MREPGAPIARPLKQDGIAHVLRSRDVDATFSLRYFAENANTVVVSYRCPGSSTVDGNSG